MRVRVYTSLKADSVDLRNKIPEISTIVVPVGEWGLFDAILPKPELVMSVMDWCMEKGLSYEVHET